jgi:hypothetical protein
MFGPYGNFMNDPAAQLASQFGQTAFRQGQEYIEQNVSIPWLLIFSHETQAQPPLHILNSGIAR